MQRFESFDFKTKQDWISHVQFWFDVQENKPKQFYYVWRAVATPLGLEIISTRSALNNNIRERLISFYCEDGVEHAREFYERLFGESFPVELVRGVPHDDIVPKIDNVFKDVLRTGYFQEMSG